MSGKELIKIGREQKIFKEMIDIDLLEKQFPDIDYKEIKDFNNIDRETFAKYIYPNHYDAQPMQSYIDDYYKQYIKGVM